MFYWASNASGNSRKLVWNISILVFIWTTIILLSNIVLETAARPQTTTTESGNTGTTYESTQPSVTKTLSPLQENIFSEKLDILLDLHHKLIKEKVEQKKPDDGDEDYYLPKNYDKQTAPKISESSVLPNGTTIKIERPVICTTYFNIRSVRDVDEVNEKVTLDMDLMMVWLDGNIRNQLRANNLTLSSNLENLEQNLIPMKAKFADKIWIPDVIFEEVETVARTIALNNNNGQIILFNPDFGAIFLGEKLLITLQCDMNFHHYPMDTQKCEFHLRSSSYPSSQMTLTWHPSNGVYLHEISDPNFDFQIPSHSVKEFHSPVDLGPQTRQARTSSYLKFEIWMRRKTTYHLVQTYLPSVFFILVTWLCYLIPSKMFEARIGVTMTTLLTMTSMFSSIRESTPIVSYVKAIDVWMVSCIFFIFITLVDFTVGVCIQTAKVTLKAESADIDFKDGEKLKKIRRTIRIYEMIEIFLEKYLVIIIVLLFAICKILYWTWLITDSEYLQWSVNETHNRI